VRHRIGAVKAEPLEGDSIEFKWHIVPGLANQSDGYLSFQAEIKQGYYLMRNGDKVQLAKHDGTSSFNENATFKMVPGLIDDHGLSFQAYNDNRLYLYQQENNFLYLNEIETEDQRRNATFQVDGLKAGYTDHEPESESKSGNKTATFAVILLGAVLVVVFAAIRVKGNKSSYI
jgi:hypothetical protein